VLVLVLQNEVAAMTGGQAVPDLRKVVEAITPDVSVFDIDAGEVETINGTQKMTGKNEKLKDTPESKKKAGHEIEKQISGPKLSELVQEKLALPGLSVIFIKGKCRKY
jgi:indolepyruvate ferredoxin oxidoreductase alpha subunit